MFSLICSFHYPSPDFLERSLKKSENFSGDRGLPAFAEATAWQSTDDADENSEAPQRQHAFAGGAIDPIRLHSGQALKRSKLFG
jgi:hypothetical protein